MKHFIVLVLLIPYLSLGQSKSDSIWKPMQYFIGKWSRIGGGEPGNGKYERVYENVLNEKFIEVNNQSTYPPSEGNKNKGETHKDVGFISYDKARKKFILRQFHIEGFVNQYRLVSISSDERTMIFLSEAIENIPSGFRAKETYKIVNQDEFIETFEIAEPGKEFTLYTEVRFKRI